MVSTPTTRVRLEKQGLGDNLNTWGSTNLNAALDRIDEAVAGVTSVAIAGASTTLTSTNYTADQARSACLIFTGTLSANSTVTVPNVQKTYLIINNTTQGAYSLTLKTAAGSGYALRPGPQAVYCDGTDVYRATPRLDQAPLPTGSVDLNSQKITNLATPTASTDAVTKAYADAAGAGASASATASTIAQRTATATIAATGIDVTAGTRFLGYTATSTHQAGNAGSVTFGVDDGGNDTGLVVTNSWSGGLSSQYIDLKTAEGGVSTATTRLRVTAAGYVQIGQTSTTTPGYSGNTTLGYGLWPSGRLFLSQDTFSNWNQNTDGILCNFARSGSTVGSIYVDTIGTTYNTSSDYRLKENVQPMTGALDRLLLLKPSRFSYKVDQTHTLYDGFIAHEVSPVVPQAVNGQKDAVDAQGNPRYQGLDASRLVPLLVGAVQELAARVAELEGGAA